MTARKYDVEVVAPDGAVRIYAPEEPGQPWQAMVLDPAAGGPSTEVAWTRGGNGIPSRYACDRCGLGHRYDHCRHTRAALAAREIAETEGLLP
jgi:hypothetical protein